MYSFSFLIHGDIIRSTRFITRSSSQQHDHLTTSAIDPYVDNVTLTSTDASCGCKAMASGPGQVLTYV